MVIPKDELWEDFQDGNLLEKYITLFIIAEQHYLRPSGKTVAYFSLFMFWAFHGVSLFGSYTSVISEQAALYAAMYKIPAAAGILYGFGAYVWKLDQEGELEERIQKIERVFP